MTAQLFMDAMGEIDDKYIQEAALYQRAQRSLILIWAKRAACFLGALILIGAAILAFSTEVRAEVEKWIIEHYDGWLRYSSGIISETYELEGYELGYVPDEYRLVDVFENETYGGELYCDEDGHSLQFYYQGVYSSSSLNIKIDDCIIKTEQIHGYDIDLWMPEDNEELVVAAIWSDGDVMFYIVGWLDLETVCKMVEGIRLK